MLSVESSCHYNGNFKNGKNRLWTNARPSGAIPTNPRPPWAKARMQKPQGGGKFFVQIPGGALEFNQHMALMDQQRLSEQEAQLNAISQPPAQSNYRTFNNRNRFRRGSHRGPRNQ